MTKLEAIADGKVRAAITRELESLAKDIEALKARNAAKGLLLSGATVNEAVERCSIAVDRIRDALITQMKWVVDSSLLCTESLGRRLVALSRDHLDRALEETSKVMTEVTTLVKHPGLMGDMRNKLMNSHERALTEISLSIDGELEAACTKWKRKLAGAVPNLVKSVFGWLR